MFDRAALGVCSKHRLYLGVHFVGYGLFELIKAFVDYYAPLRRFLSESVVNREVARLVAKGTPESTARLMIEMAPTLLASHKLLTQIGGRIDESSRDAGIAAPLNQKRGPAAAIFGVARITIAPTKRRTRHAA